MPARKVWEGNSIQKVFFILGLAPGAIRLARVCSAPLQWAVASVFPAFEDLAPHDCIVSRFSFATFFSCKKSGQKCAAAALLSLKIYVKVSAALCSPRSLALLRTQPAFAKLRRTKLTCGSLTLSLIFTVQN